ncbi:MAG: glycosyltransferase family 2 protein [Nitrososphaerota archaeon]|nr:glycosyltransferase family 2 protein [Nitrososphaerota archaeon]
MVAITYVFLFLQIFLFVISSYWLIIGFFGLGKATRPPEREAQKRFLLLIPAHNEEKVIGNLVENLMQLDYPRPLYKVLVIADNSTDKTADIARNLGAEVLEHTSLPGEKKGKPHAIKYALDEIDDQLINEFDAIAIFDADNLVTLNYLREMNNHLLNGEKLIQCYLDTKNPNDNFITLGYAATYFYMNRSWQLAKYRLGLGNAVGGTGFCVDTQVIKKVGWTARSLTEDLEFTIQCLLKGIKATWCHHARVYDEKPEKFNASCVQRLRWARGHWDVCFKYFGRLMLRAVTKLDVCAFDGAIYLLNPAILLFGTTVWIAWATSVFLFKQNYFILFPSWLWISLFIFSCIYILTACRIDANKKFSKIKIILSMLFLNFTYIPLFIWGLITYKSKTWIRTEHIKNISIIAHNAKQAHQ